MIGRLYGDDERARYDRGAPETTDAGFGDLNSSQQTSAFARGVCVPSRAYGRVRAGRPSGLPVDWTGSPTLLDARPPSPGDQGGSVNHTETASMHAHHPFLTFEQHGASLVTAAPNDSLVDRLSRREEQLAALLDLLGTANAAEFADTLQQHQDDLDALACELTWEVISLHETVRAVSPVDDPTVEKYK